MSIIEDIESWNLFFQHGVNDMKVLGKGTYGISIQSGDYVFKFYRGMPGAQANSESILGQYLYTGNLMKMSDVKYTGPAIPSHRGTYKKTEQMDKLLNIMDIFTTYNFTTIKDVFIKFIYIFMRNLAGENINTFYSFIATTFSNIEPLLSHMIQVEMNNYIYTINTIHTDLLLNTYQKVNDTNETLKHTLQLYDDMCADITHDMYNIIEKIKVKTEFINGISSGYKERVEDTFAFEDVQQVLNNYNDENVQHLLTFIKPKEDVSLYMSILEYIPDNFINAKVGSGELYDIIIDIIIQICGTLHGLHHEIGFVHGDLSKDNIRFINNNEPTNFIYTVRSNVELYTKTNYVFVLTDLGTSFIKNEYGMIMKIPDTNILISQSYKSDLHHFGCTLLLYIASVVDSNDIPQHLLPLISFIRTYLICKLEDINEQLHPMLQDLYPIIFTRLSYTYVKSWYNRLRFINTQTEVDDKYWIDPIFNDRKISTTGMISF